MAEKERSTASKYPGLGRRRYDGPGSINTLPFRSESRKGTPPLNWDVPPATDYGVACDVGRQYAAHFLQYIKDNPDRVGGNLLGHIAADIDFKAASPTHGYWVGFFSHLERFIEHGVKGVDVFDDLKRIEAHYARIEAKREAERARQTKARVDRMNAARKAKGAAAHQRSNEMVPSTHQAEMQL